MLHKTWAEKSGSSNNVIYGTEPSSGSGPIVRPFLTHLAGPPGDAGNHLTWTWKPRARLTNNCTADTQHHTLPPLPLCSLTPIKFKTNCVMIDLLFSNHACTTYCCHGPAPRELIVCRSCSRQKKMSRDRAPAGGGRGRGETLLPVFNPTDSGLTPVRESAR